MDERIKDYVDARYHKAESNNEVAAFAMTISGYRLIEFSDPGYAFYAYKSSNLSAQMRYNRERTVEALRDGTMPYLVYRKGYEFIKTMDEGRLSHLDGDRMWEAVFAHWLRKYVGIPA
jgi:hypothetical protein